MGSQIRQGKWKAGNPTLEVFILTSCTCKGCSLTALPFGPFISEFPGSVRRRSWHRGPEHQREMRRTDQATSLTGWFESQREAWIRTPFTSRGRGTAQVSLHGAGEKGRGTGNKQCRRIGMGLGWGLGWGLGRGLCLEPELVGSGWRQSWACPWPSDNQGSPLRYQSRKLEVSH